LRLRDESGAFFTRSSQPRVSNTRSELSSAVIAMQRRKALKACFLCLAPPGLWPAGVTSVSASTAVSNNLRARLAAALHSIGNDTCAAAARRMESAMHQRDVHLQLRNAALTSSDTLRIADVLRTSSHGETLRLRSFSLSYNTDIGDAGALHLARALPETLPELGLVGCKIGEAGGTALLEWAKTATRLRMICVENNDFSAALASQFRDLANTRPYPAVYV
jgi:hypothetical protein